jgi:glycolate oxidase FAD binding subunit
VAPGVVIEPTTPEQLAAALSWASRERLTTVIRGRGTKLGWGRTPAGVDLIVTTSRLNGLVAHRHGDLTATVQAGATLTDLNRQLATQGQWLPLDTAFDHATIGGLVATNDSGPLRHRYGTPRDLLIGITLALTDGRLVRSGGHVVKNVAGYDLGKLVSGSFGTLAAIADATFKLSPIPQTSRTVLAAYADRDLLARDVTALADSQLEPTAVDLHVMFGRPSDRLESVLRLLVRFATSPESADAQANEARGLMQGRGIDTLAGAAEAALWAEQVRRPWMGPGVVVRFSWLPAALPSVLALVEGLHQSSGCAMDLVARVALGAGVCRIDAEDDVARSTVEMLRSRTELVANVVVLRQGAVRGSRVDTWGPAGGTAAVLRALKETFDPAGILNAGRGPI